MARARALPARRPCAAPLGLADLEGDVGDGLVLVAPQLAQARAAARHHPILHVRAGHPHHDIAAGDPVERHRAQPCPEGRLAHLGAQAPAHPVPTGPRWRDRSGTGRGPRLRGSARGCGAALRRPPAKEQWRLPPAPMSLDSASRSSLLSAASRSAPVPADAALRSGPGFGQTPGVAAATNRAGACNLRLCCFSPCRNGCPNGRLRGLEALYGGAGASRQRGRGRKAAPAVWERAAAPCERRAEPSGPTRFLHNRLVRPGRAGATSWRCAAPAATLSGRRCSCAKLRLWRRA